MPLPPSTSWERKEMLYQKAITLYEHGNYYEVRLDFRSTCFHQGEIAQLTPHAR